MPIFDAFAAHCQREKPRLAIVLGSGLGPVVERWGRLAAVPFADIPTLTGTTVGGHRGQLALAHLSQQPVLIFEGRLHFYEGHSWDRVVASSVLAKELGAAMVLHTNAAGGIREDFVPGDLMVLTGHLEVNRPYWWRSSRPGSPYSERLRTLLHRAAAAENVSLREGVYAGVTGPCYETRAEIRALRAWGADAVGMSTTREIAKAFELGLECAAVSCITNLGTGLSAGPLSHEEVMAVGSSQTDKIERLLTSFVGCVQAGHLGGQRD